MPFQPLQGAENRTEFLPSADGGVNSRAVAWNLQDTEYADGYNISIEQLGVWKRRKGAASLGGLEALPGGNTWHRDAFGAIALWGVWGSNIYSSVGGGAWARKASGISLFSNVLHQFVEGVYTDVNFANNQFRAIYGCQCVPNSNSTELTRLFVFRGDNVAAINQATQESNYAPQAITYFQGRLWKANDQLDGDGSDLSWSELDDGLTFSPANQLSIEPGIGGRITAVFPVRGSSPRLVVFKEDAVAILNPRWGSSSALIPGAGDELDTLTSSIQLVTDKIGCIATKSLTTAPSFGQGDVLFLARDGVRSLSRSSDDTLSGVGPRITEKVPAWIDRINFSAAHKAVAEIYDNAYHLAIPLDGSQENNFVMRMELATGAWSLHNWSARDLMQAPLTGDERFLFQNNSGFTEESTVTGLPSNRVYHLSRGYSGDLDPGATYVNYELVTKAFVFRNPKSEKKFDRLMFLGTVDASETHHMRVAYRVDFKNWETVPTEVVFGVPGTEITQGQTPLVWEAPVQKMIQRRIGLQDVNMGTMVQVRFSGSRDEAQPQIYYTDVEADNDAQVFDNED
jgi:hypothetical protein